MKLELEQLPGTFAVVRFDPEDRVPDWALAGSALSVLTRTAGELSVVCDERLLPAGRDRSGGWAALRVRGTLDHAAVGVLATLAVPLAEAEVPIFALSSYDTDYLMVPEAQLEPARAALHDAGHRVA